MNGVFSNDVGVVTNKLSQGIKSCELALSSASTRAWKDKIKDAQKAHYAAVQFVQRSGISEHDAHRIDQRIIHLKTLLDELNQADEKDTVPENENEWLALLWA